MHIYTAKMQPATDWTDTHSGEPMQMGWSPETLIYAHCCGKKRQAKNLLVQSYYDGLCIWCAEGHGCKHPQAVAKKRRREHRNRSLAQQARRAREKTPNVEHAHRQPLQTMNLKESSMTATASENHPDSGGNAGKMAEINKAWEQTQKELGDG